jgi:hypothetical protein
MSSERKINPFSALILVISLLGIILLLIGPFAGFYLTSVAENRYSCFDCGYTTLGDLFAQIMILILLILQIIVMLNDLLPKKFIDQDLDKFGLLIAFFTVIFAIIGIASFGIAYAEYEWWPELGFYAGIIAGLLNLILMILKIKSK